MPVDGVSGAGQPFRPIGASQPPPVDKGSFPHEHVTLSRVMHLLWEATAGPLSQRKEAIDALNVALWSKSPMADQTFIKKYPLLCEITTKFTLAAANGKPADFNNMLTFVHTLWGHLAGMSGLHRDAYMMFLFTKQLPYALTGFAHKDSAQVFLEVFKLAVYTTNNGITTAPDSTPAEKKLKGQVETALHAMFGLQHLNLRQLMYEQITPSVTRSIMNEASKSTGLYTAGKTPSSSWFSQAEELGNIWDKIPID